MIRRILFSLTALLALTHPLSAQQLRVQAGDHEGFTRLVAQIPAGSEWSVKKRNRSVEIVVPRQQRGFDTQDVFTLIQPDRIENISGSSDRLTLTLGCDCQVSAFQVDENFVAIDVASPGYNLLTPIIADQAPEAPKPTGTQTAAQDDTIVLPLASKRKTQFSLPLLVEPAQQDLPASVPMESENSALLTEMRQKLARELGDAASRGILNPNIIEQPADVPPTQQVPSPTPEPLPLPEAITDDPNRNMRITSSNDTIESRTSAAANTRNPRASCSLGKKLNVSEWNDGQGFQTQIGNGRAALYGEFDRLNPASLVALTKSYLYFGFGIEARQALMMDAETAAAHSHLLEIAQIIDQSPAVAKSKLAPLVECNNDAALWAQLAGDQLAENAVLNTQAALITLNDLPSHLREILAPALANRLLAFGNPDDAAAALRSIERLPTPPKPAAQVAQAEHDIAAGEHATGTAALASVAAENVAEAPEALIKLVQTQIATQQPVSENDIQLLDAYAKEFSETGLGNQLKMTHLRALIDTDQFAQAEERLTALEPDSDGVGALETTLFKAIIERAGDIPFLEYAFPKSPTKVSALDTVSRFTLAKRFLNLGFAEQARNVLDQFAEAEKTQDYVLLAAQTSLALSEPFEAQARLLNVTGAQADLLRAQALMQIGQHAQAADFFRQANATEQAGSAAWLAENWQEITPPEAEVFGAISEVSNTEIDLPAEIDGLLTRSAAAIDESDAARRTIEALLADTQLSSPAEVSQ